MRSMQRTMAAWQLETNARESEPKVRCIHDDCSRSMRADDAQAFTAKIGFKIESIAASQASLPWALLMKHSRAEKVSL